MNAPVAALLSPEPIPSATHARSPGLFGFLDQSHREIALRLQMLREVVDAIDMDGLIPEVRARARDVLQWFDTEAREHHLDEERHVFPALLASSDESVRHVARRLRQDHGWLEEDWLEISPSLAAAADGNQWFDLDVLRHGAEIFEQLYLDHITLEESLAYPEARRSIPATELEAMGIEMARRRALREAKEAASSD